MNHVNDITARNSAPRRVWHIPLGTLCGWVVGSDLLGESFMAISSVAPKSPQAHGPVGRAAQATTGRQPLLLWPPVVTAVVGSLILIAVFFMILPPRRALATATVEVQAAEVKPDLPAAEETPAPATVTSAPIAKLADNLPTAMMAKAPAAPALPVPESPAPLLSITERAAASQPVQVDSNPFVFLPETPNGKSTCQQYGTKVDFYDTPTLAAGHALKEQKLLFVLHVAGNFEEPGFT